LIREKGLSYWREGRREVDQEAEGQNDRSEGTSAGSPFPSVYYR